MKMIVTCGGTGGHITPALAIADTVRQNLPKAEILFVGTEGGMENTLVARAGYPIRTLAICGLRRSLSLQNLRALYLAVRATAQAKAILRELAPDIVVGTGGYACYPMLRAAAELKIPTAVHESNAVPGLAVRRLAGRVDRVWLNFEAAALHLPRGAAVRVVGNPLPVRCAKDSWKKPQDGILRVLSFGGSLGASALNKAVLFLMETERIMPEVRHCHATGRREYDAAHAAFASRGLSGCTRLELLPYIEDMPRRMAEADLVICRAGAMSISELAAAGVAAILVPSPNVTGNHQYKNAKVLSDAGAAVLVSECDLDVTLRGQAVALLKSETQRAALAASISRFARPEANRLIYTDICDLVKK